MKRLAWMFGACVLSVALAACGDDGGGKRRRSDGGDGDGAGDGDGDVGDGDDAGTAGPPEKRAWTFFVYGHGDHTLSNSLARDMAEMAEAKLNASVHVVVLADFDASQIIAGSSERFPTGAHLFTVAGGGQEPTLVESSDELNFDDPEVLAASIAGVFTQFPSDHRALVLWDHGGSWSGGFGGDTQDGTVQPTAMSVSVLAAAVKSGLADAEITTPLDILAFDTCLMAGAEVATEFTDLADIYVANAEIDYGDGWDYNAFLSYLAAHPNDTAAALAAQEVKLWDAHHLTASSNDTLLRSHVAIDLAKFNDFLSAYGDFTEALVMSEVVTPGQLARAGYFALPAYMNQLENPGDSPALRDVGLFLARFAGDDTDPTAAAAADAAKQALDAAILGRSQGTIREAAGQHGLHIQLPLASAMSPELGAAYTQLAPSFNAVSGWDAILEVLRLSNDGVAPVVTATAKNADHPDATNLPAVSFSVSDPDLAEAQIELAQYTDPIARNELVLYGVIAKGAIDADTGYEVSWDGQLTALSDGSGGLQAVYTRVWEDVGSDVTTGEAIAPLLATFGVVVSSDGEELLGALLFQDGDAEAGLLTLLDPPLTLPLSQVASDLPGTTFTPILFSLSLATGEEGLLTGTTIPLNRPGVAISRGSAAAGAYAFVTSATDVFGNLGADLQSVNIVEPITP